MLNYAAYRWIEFGLCGLVTTISDHMSILLAKASRDVVKAPSVQSNRVGSIKFATHRSDARVLSNLSMSRCVGLYLRAE